MSEQANGAAPAATPAPAASATPAQTDWTASLNDEQKGYVGNKGFKDPAMVLNSYMHLEKLLGVPQDQLLKLPAKADDVEGWKGIHAKLGMPEKPDGYVFNLPEGSDKTGAEFAQKMFHELGLTKKQGEAVFTKWNDFAANFSKQQETQASQEAEKQVTALKTEWGKDHDVNMNIAKAAVAKFGVKPETIDTLEKAMGYADTMKFLHKVGVGTGEHGFEAGKGGSAGGVMTPAQARARINVLVNDSAFAKAVENPGSAERAEWDKLNLLASAG